jgi:hypothetical protein
MKTRSRPGNEKPGNEKLNSRLTSKSPLTSFASIQTYLLKSVQNLKEYL